MDNSVIDKSYLGADSTPAVPNELSSRTSTVKFFGKVGEYYAIWIVNLLLTIVTLGIYSAWAKVRNQRYFQSNTEVDGHRFAYLATPIQILKGRIIALLLFIAFYFVTAISPFMAGILVLCYFFAVPWLLCKSFKFNLQMISYRNIRFNFHGQYAKALLVFMVYPVLSVLTLYTTLPMALKAIDRFIYDNISFGGKPFKTELSTGTYYKASFGALFIGIAFFVVSLMLFGIEMSKFSNPDIAPSLGIQAILMGTYLAVFVVSGAFYTKIIRNHLFENTQVEDVATFKSTVTLGRLVWLNFSNLIALICTLGLALPWVKIRNAHYYCNATEVTVLPGVETVLNESVNNMSALGDEISEVFDFDVAIT